MRNQSGRVPHLFSQHNIFDVLESQRQQLQKEVKELPEQILLNTSIEDLVAYINQKYQIEVPTLLLDQAAVDQREAPIRLSRSERFLYDFDENDGRSLPGIIVTLEIPFDGDANMFTVRPSTFNSAPPIGEVRGQRLVLSQSGVSMDASQVQAGFDRTIADINQYLEWQKSNAKTFNTELPKLARQHIEGRRDKLLANQNLVAGLRFQLKERTDSPKTYSAPIFRKKIEPRLPAASTSTYRPEPVLLESDYQNILKIIHDMTVVIERSPAAFQHMKEEDIRQHFLVQLNGHYEGKATGETFNAEGKTDILIRHEGRNIFIAECKFWRGKKTLMESIDQVLSYLSWRDTKAAIIIFNRARSFSESLVSIKDAIPDHKLFKSGPKIEGETRFRFVFGQPTDTNREVILTVMAFNMPQKGELLSGLAD